MEHATMSCTFSAKPYYCSSAQELRSLIFVSLPKELSVEIRDGFKWMEQGWGAHEVTAKTGSSQ